MAISGELTINLKAIQDNYKLLDGLSAKSCVTGAAVKADAYGIGMGRVAPALYDVGARHFFVATLDEGIELRGILPQSEIYILNGFLNSERFVYKKYKLTPVLNSLVEIQLYQAFARELSEKQPAIINFDTGMNRLGMPCHEVERFGSDMLDGIDLKYVMSHFSSSDEKDSPLNQAQYQKFVEITSSFNGVKKSLCNSGGIFLSGQYHMDLTRPGIALYGGNPTGEAVNPMNQVVTLGAPILQVKSIKKDSCAGYNATYRFDKNGDVAVVSIGYADGFLRFLGNGASLYWQGMELPIRGRVSMDLVICDLSKIPEHNYPKVGDMLEVIGEHQSLDALAKDAGTISYEILTSLGNRYTREYY